MNFLAVVLLTAGLYGSDPDFISGSELRTFFHQQEISEDQLKEVMARSINNTDAVSIAYMGMCQTMMAQYAFLPTTKLEYFNNGKQAIEEAISTDRSNAELRYIRLLVQLNAPWFLGYNKDISEDMEAFLKAVYSEEISGDWKKKFTGDLLMSKNLLPEQKSELEKAMLSNFTRS